MFGSQVLEVMIGLLLIYLSLSVACSGIKEVLAAIFDLRSKTLEKAIRTMLHDANGTVTQQIFNYPVIAGTAPEGKKPSYISARNFALALCEVLAPADAGQARTVQQLKAGIANIPSAKLQKTLTGLVDAAQGDGAAAQKRIEDWFDDTMQRVGGWYKRTAQKLIFASAFVLCLCLNADTFAITRELWSDEALRNAVVAQATKRVQHGMPATTMTAGTVPEIPTSDLTLAKLQEVANEVKMADPPPLGWASREAVWTELWSWPGGLLKLLGILVTSFAILMGAPFWFDLLNKVINLRLSGQPPQSTN